jgi:hypothetical protein
VQTAAARRAAALNGGIVGLAELRGMGWTSSAVRAQFDAGRWRRFGRAVLLHNGAPTEAERHRIVLLNCGPRAVWTAFTALQLAGLTGWERDTTHVLVPCGSRMPRLRDLPFRLHFTSAWDTAQQVVARRMHRPADALIVAATTFRSARPACGIVCAGVQQRLVTVPMLRAALQRGRRARHHALLQAAVEDIGQGAQALSEVDFAQLCRRYALPTPARQAIRTDARGRRRYLDAEWVRRDGRRVVAEVDGALHLVPTRWWDDQLRQNELVLDGSLVLRYPSIVVRTEPELVASQLAALLSK